MIALLATYLWALNAAPAPVVALPSGPLNADQCVKLALTASPKVSEAQASVDEYLARLKEVESTFYPKLMGLAWVAPNYRSTYTDTGNGTMTNVQTQWRSLSDWGPYVHLEAILAEPIYTFGQAENGEVAARERAEVEKGRLEEAKNAIALEVRRYYYLRLYAQSFLPALKSAAKLVADAQRAGQEKYDKSTGEVSEVDLMKLRYGGDEVAKYIKMAEFGASLAMSALKHTMGLKELDELILADETLPAVGDEPYDESALVALLTESANNRPEWQQIKHGKAAASAWSLSELDAMWPALFVAGQIQANWTPTRQVANSPYWYDPYNMIIVGVAVGFQFNSDPAKAIARSHIADATGEQIAALERFAATGIPLQIRKAYIEARQAKELVELAKDGVEATRKWMVFAATAYTTGTGEAKDVLEGLVAYMGAKRGYYDNLLAYHTARAELGYAAGRQ